jgi:hypothetical protein
MDKYTNCIVCNGEGFVEVAGLIEDENDSVECPACEVVGFLTAPAF